MPQKTLIYNKDDYRYKGIVKNYPTYAYSYGVILAQNISSRIGIEYGFCGSRVEQEFKIYPYEGSVPYIENRKSLLYVDIPLLLRAELLSKPKNIISFSAGPKISIMMSEDGIIPVYYSNPIGIPTDTVSSFDLAEAAGAYRKFVLGVAGSLGWNTRIYKNVFLLVQLRSEYTLTDIEDKSFDTLYKDDTYKDVFLLYNKNRPATHIFIMGLGVGLSLKLR